MRLPVLQVSAKLFRSPQPDFEDFIALKGKGINGVVNLREEATESSFFARQAKLDYRYISVVDWQLPSVEQVLEFIEYVEANGPVLVHCAAGVGRTGTFVACYRVHQGMDVETALEVTNQETPMPGVTMNQIQRDFVREFAVSLR
jgi:atypical dual specificity phosphatase